MTSPNSSIWRTRVRRKVKYNEFLRLKKAVANLQQRVDELERWRHETEGT